MHVARAVPTLLVLLAVLIQVSVVQQVEIVDTSADLVVLVIVSVALLTNSVSGAAYGFLGGIALALFAAVPLGPHAMIGTLIGYFTGRWGEVLITDEHPVPPLLAGVCATVAMHLGRPLVDFLIVPTTDTTQGMWSHALVVTLLNAVLATPVYLLVRRTMRGSMLAARRAEVAEA